MKPEFVDNQELRLVEALRGHLDWLHKTYVYPVHLSIATGYFNPGAFTLLADQLERLPEIRLLLGAEPLPQHSTPIRMPGDPPEDKFEKHLIQKALNNTTSRLETDRDRLPFTSTTEQALKRL